MGLLKKFKNIFVEEYEEEEEEVVQMPSSFESRIPTRTEIKKPEPIKEERPVIKPSITVEPKPVEVEKVPVHVEEEKIKIEPVQPKKEDKFVFPVYFDESDFATIDNKKEEKPKMELPKRENKVVKPEIKKEEKKESSYKEAYNNKRATLTEDKKIFKPTPIISPVYGILDKNYYKEDIVVSPIPRNYNISSDKSMTIDDVRNKAYGTLEDDLAGAFEIDKNIDEQANNEESGIFSASDFESAIEEDKKRDIAKDGLKADIESLLNNDEFTNAINFKRASIKEDIVEEKENEVEDAVIPEEEETIEEESTLIDDIMSLAESGKHQNIEDIVNNDEKAVNDKEEDDLELPDNIADTEIDNAYDDVSDLNDSDLFNLIDSMYDKEDK